MSVVVTLDLADRFTAQGLLKARPDWAVDVYDSLPVPFGLVRYGVAADHQGSKAITRQFERIFERQGARFFGNVSLGRDVTLEALRGAYDAVVLAAGLAGDRDHGLGEADGIHSPVRRALFGEDDPRFTGLISWRAVVPRAAVADLPNLDSFTKWWGPTPDRQIVTFPLSRGEEIFVFATTGQDDWTEEGWTLPGDVAELRAAFADFHPEARALLAACTEVTRSALHVCEPMAEWSRGSVALLGDAAHPMVPFMAQGACMAIEDAVVLSRALGGVDAQGIPAALRHYQAVRIPRTSRVQERSLANEWLKEGGNADWVYGYDAWSVPIPDAAPAA
ncbi:FAD-dependent monooxygenase [Paracoccus halophilus]|uniref:FAD-dependent monooxygenase n=1 Tax=Paracoccus halophilus TaxID=376733 RepID=UPI0009DF97DC